MENKMMMPASYNVLSNEEMTYTEGGATVGQALAAWFWPGCRKVFGGLLFRLRLLLLRMPGGFRSDG